jgi:hypothetical protein
MRFTRLIAIAAIGTAGVLGLASQAGAATPTDAKATGTVAWSVDLSYAQLGVVTGTTVFSANNKTGGTLAYTNSLGSYVNGTVTPGSVVKNGNTVTFRGVITDASPVYNGGTGYFVGVVKDVSTSGSNGDQIAVFVNEEPFDIHADVTSGNLTVF